MFLAFLFVLGTAAATECEVEEFPSIDGTCRIDDDPLAGAFEDIQSRGLNFQDNELINDYADGTDEPNDDNRPGPRTVSNAICDADRFSRQNLRRSSLILIYFGQFVDHDITLIPVDEGDSFPIEVPENDDNFAAGSELEFARSSFVRGVGGVRQFQNLNTGFIDLSNVYGDTEEISDAIRAGVDGLLATRILTASDGRQIEDLPLNSELPEPVEVELGGQTNTATARGCGERRCQENSALQAITTLFVRNHNRLARELREENPNLSDDDLFQMARLRNIIQYQSILYTEFLPVLLGDDALSPLSDNDNREPGTNLMFSSCAFRMGHSGIGDTLPFFTSRFNEVDSLSLVSAFYNPAVLDQAEATDQLLTGLTAEQHEPLDVAVVDSLRGFLFGNVQTPTDLISLNMQRGRDHGVPGINFFQDPPCTAGRSCFDDLVGDDDLADALADVYDDDFDAVDCWVGGMAEQPAPNSQLGATFTRIIADQFEIYRNTDPFYFERLFQRSEFLNDPDLRESLTISFSELMALNTLDFVNDRHPAFLARPFYVSRLERDVIGVRWTGFDENFNELDDTNFRGVFVVALFRGNALDEFFPARNQEREKVFENLVPGETYRAELFFLTADVRQDLETITVTTYSEPRNNQNNQQNTPNNFQNFNRQSNFQANQQRNSQNNRQRNFRNSRSRTRGSSRGTRRGSRRGSRR